MSLPERVLIFYTYALHVHVKPFLLKLLCDALNKTLQNE